MTDTRPIRPDFAEDLQRRNADAVVRRFEGLARNLAKEFFVPGGDYDDMLQEARIGIYRAVESFRGDPRAFPAFAVMCCRRQLITALKTAQRAKHSPLNNALSLHTPVGDDDLEVGDLLPSCELDPIERMEVRDQLAAIVGEARRLSPMEGEAFRRIVLCGETYEDAASSVGVATKSIDNALQRALRRMRDAETARRAFSRGTSRVARSTP